TQGQSEALFRVTRPQITNRSNEPAIASSHVDSDQNSSTPTPKMAEPNQPPTIAPSTPKSSVASQPPPCLPGLMALAIAPAISPRPIQPMKPIFPPSQ